LLEVIKKQTSNGHVTKFCLKITGGENYKCSNKYHNIVGTSITIQPIAFCRY